MTSETEIIKWFLQSYQGVVFALRIVDVHLGYPGQSV